MADDRLTEKDKEAVEDASEKPSGNPPKNTADPVSGDKGVDVKEIGSPEGDK